MEELYDIPDFTGYKASKNGNIYSMIPKGCRDRFDRSRWLNEPKLLKTRDAHGYCRVYMRRDSTDKREKMYMFIELQHRYLSQTRIIFYKSIIKIVIQK